MFVRIWPLFVKELLANWRDKANRYLLIFAPILELLVFSFAATQEVKNVPLAVLDQDRTVLTRELISRFEGSPQFSRVIRLDSVADIAPIIDARISPAVLHIGSDFSLRLHVGEPAKIQLILDGRRSNAAQIIQGYASEIVDRFNSDLTQLAQRQGPTSVVVARTWFNPNSDPLWSTVPSLFVVIIAAFGMMVSALSVARERELGSFEQLLVSPLTSTEILIGKALAALAIAMTLGVVVLLIAIFGLGIPMEGSIVMLVAAMIVFLLSIIGIGLFVSALADTQQQAIIGAFMFLSPAILLSGYATPIASMPDWLQTVTLANPIRHFVVISKGVFLKDLPADVIMAHLWPLALIAGVTLSAAAWLFRHKTA